MQADRRTRVITFALKNKLIKDLLKRLEFCLHMGYKDRHKKMGISTVSTSDE